MSDKKLDIESVTLVNRPPRPVDGNGEIIVNVLGGEVTLAYRDGEISDVFGGDGFDIDDMTMKTPLGIVTCFKCAYDSVTGQRVCWPVPC